MYSPLKPHYHFPRRQEEAARRGRKSEPDGKENILWWQPFAAWVTQGWEPGIRDGFSPYMAFPPFSPIRALFRSYSTSLALALSLTCTFIVFPSCCQWSFPLLGPSLPLIPIHFLYHSSLGLWVSLSLSSLNIYLFLFSLFSYIYSSSCCVTLNLSFTCYLM